MDFEYYIDIFPYILEGMKTTIIVFSLTIVFSLPLSVILASLTTIDSQSIKKIISIYTWIFRGTPLLLQLYFGMYGLPAFGISLNRFNVAILIFTLNYGAYFTEIIRGSILSISEGQKDVSKTLGFNKYQTYIYIVIPQALKRSIQSISNEVITLIKDTALVAAVALNDLLRNAKEIVSRDYRIEAFIIVGLLYILMSYVVVKVSKKVELKYAYYR
jgi:polar amino acid transport system permease protein